MAWTHVSAIIRFDGLRLGGEPEILQLPELGNQDGQDGPEQSFDVPEGTEGSLKYRVWQNPFPNSVTQWTVMFWGDLRNVTDETSVFEYFKRITEGKIIRSGLLEIRNSHRRVRVWSYEKRKWVSRVRTRKVTRPKKEGGKL